MKKAVILCAALCAAGALYGQETVRQRIESRWAGGLAWGNYFDSYQESGTAYRDFTSSPGVQVYSDIFVKGKALGIFSHISVLFPVHYAEKADGNDTGVDQSSFGSMLQLDFLVGPAVKFDLGRRVEMGLGLGAHAFMGVYDIIDQTGINMPPLGTGLSFMSASGAMYSYSLGVGLDLNFSFRITDKVFFGLGTAFSLDILKSVDVDMEWKINGQPITISNTDNLSGYLGWNIKPYLVIGIHYWQITEYGYGKLPE